MNRPTDSKNYNFFFIVIVLFLMAAIYLSTVGNQRPDYTRADLEWDIKNGNIISAEIIPNQETPTGSVNLKHELASPRTMYVTDVSEIEQYLMENNIPTIVSDVKTDGWFLT